MTTTARPTARLTVRERARLSRWMVRFELAMQDYPAREVRRLRRELRAAVLDDATRVGLAEALRDLGSPRRLAAAYFADLDHERPRWTDGAVLGSLVGVVLPFYMWLAWQGGALDAVDAMGGGEVDLRWLGAPMTLHRTDDALWMEVHTAWGPFALSAALFAVFFALGSRLWRLRH